MISDQSRNCCRTNKITWTESVTFYCFVSDSFNDVRTWGFVSLKCFTWTISDSINWVTLIKPSCVAGLKNEDTDTVRKASHTFPPPTTTFLFPCSWSQPSHFLLFWFPRNWANDIISLFLPLPLQDWPFDDGAPPSNQIVDDWLNLLKLKFREEPGCCVAVHCVAGLGRWALTVTGIKVLCS